MAQQAPDVVIIGAGLTGATAAYTLRRAGLEVRVHERQTRTGGHVRNEWMRGIPYEPNGAHIFHTSDEQVWEMASAITEFVPYEHRVLTRLGDQLLAWPIQLHEIRSLAEWPVIERELARLPQSPDASNFETWCISSMGETLYSFFIEGYTRKQWGRDPSELSASFAPKRVELRTDGYLGLFRDPWQGWPRSGYEALVDGLLADVEVVLGSAVEADDLPDIVPGNTPVIVTAPLDDFFGCRRGELEWRGVELVPKYMPKVRHYQPATVVNEPSPDIEFTRTIETKHVFPHLDGSPGTVVCEEYPGAPVKHYPVYDARGENQRLAASYADDLHAYQRNRLVPAGRLANYQYINMDEAMREGIDAALKVLAARAM